MPKNDLVKATVVGGVVASAVTAGAILLKDEKRRKKVMKTVGDAWKKVNTAEVRQGINDVANSVKEAKDSLKMDGAESKRSSHPAGKLA